MPFYIPKFVMKIALIISETSVQSLPSQTLYFSV